MKLKTITNFKDPAIQKHLYSRIPRRYKQPVTFMIMKKNRNTLSVNSYDFFDENHVFLQNLNDFNSKNDHSFLHSHDYFEFMYLYENSDIYIEDHLYHFSRGDLLLMNRNICHSEVIRDCFDAFYLCLENTFFRDFPMEFGSLFSAKNRMEPFIMQNMEDSVINKKDYMVFHPQSSSSVRKTEHLIKEMKKEIQASKKSRKLRIYASIIDFFELLSSNKEYQMIYTNLGNFPNTKKAEKIKQLIEEHHGMISRTEIANALNYSPNHVYSIFQKVMGCSILHYCQEMQVRYFASKLEHTNLSIDLLCKECGQKNKTQLYKIFKEFYKMTPKEYREKLQSH